MARHCRSVEHQAAARVTPQEELDYRLRALRELRNHCRNDSDLMALNDLEQRIAGLWLAFGGPLGEPGCANPLEG